MNYFELVYVLLFIDNLVWLYVILLIIVDILVYVNVNYRIEFEVVKIYE